jgi:hypothetical protein
MRTLSISFVAALLGVAAGCSSSSNDTSSAAGLDSAASAAPASGTRLHAKLVTGGGAREIVGFHDTKRDEDCTFQPTEGGRMRCLPAAVLYPQTIAFADAACTVPLVQLPVQQASKCDDAPKYAMTVDASGGGCTSTTAVPRELQKLVPNSGPRYFNSGSGCTPQTPAPSSPPLFALGDTVSLIEFVEATVTPVAASGSSVSETVLVGADGSRQHFGFHSDALDADCSFEIMADDVMRCLPKADRGSVLYRDEACASPSAVRVSLNCSSTAQRFAVDAAEPGYGPGPGAGSGSCRNVRAVYSVGEYAGSLTDAFYTHSGSSTGLECSSAGLAGNLSTSSIRSINSDLTASLPTGPRIATGSGRLVPALVADASKPSLVTKWHDTERDVDCAFTRASDGKLRCLPTSTAATLFSTDGKCTSPSHVAVLTEVPCTGFSGFALVASASSACPSTTRVFALTGQPHDVANASAETAPGRCVSFTSVQKAYDATEVDPAQFVEGVEAPE